MERLDYRELVKNLLKTYLQYDSGDVFIETQLVFDTEHDHYQMLYIGWQGEERIYGCPIHIDIKDGKIWIQRDFTEAGIAQQLIDLGVPKSDIVLGFRSPFVRQFSGFAIA